MIIGITGMYASGKDTMAEYLEKKGFQHHSLSDEIRQELKERRLKPIRENMINCGNELREKFGADILAERIKMKLRKNKNYVLTSIRNQEEVKSLAKLSDFILVSVAADVKERFVRISDRKREGDPKTVKELIEKEKGEKSSKKTKQQLHTVAKMAKIIIKNEGTVEELHKKIDRLILDLRKKFQKPRPSWDEYFIGITREVAKRATCLRGKIGVVIVKNKMILSTGYNGSPRNLPHCTEVGCKIWRTIDENGNEKENCLRTVHGELNAIVQAAILGISTEGATLYGTYKPCSVCMKLIINAGIVRVVCEKNYNDDFTDKLAKEAGMNLIIHQPDKDSFEEFE